MTIHHHIQTHHRRIKRLRFLRIAVAVNSALLAVSVVTYVFTADQLLYRTHATEELVCLRICAIGDEHCANNPGCANTPTVTSDAVSSVSQARAVGQGTVTSDGGRVIAERGIVLGTSGNPTVNDTKFTTTGTTGTFTVTLTGLSPATTYYVRAFAMNIAGTSYGEGLSFTTLGEGVESTAAPAPVGAALPLPPPLTTLTEQMAERLLVPGSGAGEERYIDVQYASSYKRAGVSVQEGEIPLLTGLNITLSGTTNIKDAYIYLGIVSDVYYGVTQADSEGRWTYTVSQQLSVGTHRVTIEAVSPYHPGLTAQVSYALRIVEPSQVPAAERAEEPFVQLPTPDITKPGPYKVPAGSTKPPIPPVPYTERYAVQLHVLPPPRGFRPTNGLDVKADIISLHPIKREELTLTYTVYNEEGTRLFLKDKHISVQDFFSDQSRLVARLPLFSGQYLAIAALKSQAAVYSSTSVFTIPSPKVIELLSISFSAAEVREAAARVSWLFTTLLVLLLVLFIRERQEVRRALKHVLDQDLYRSGMIT